MHWKQLFLCPIVCEAIKSNGQDPETLSRKVSWGAKKGSDKRYVSDPEDLDKPFIVINKLGGAVDWENKGVSLQIERDKNDQDKFIFLPGTNLDDFVEVPGSEFYTVKSIEEEVFVHTGKGPTTGFTASFLNSYKLKIEKNYNQT